MGTIRRQNIQNETHIRGGHYRYVAYGARIGIVRPEFHMAINTAAAARAAFFDVHSCPSPVLSRYLPADGR